MTNIFTQAIDWVETEFSSEEKAVMDFLTPLANQIYHTALTLGKQDVAAGLTVLKDSVTTAVAAGATAIAAGQNPVVAAETAFLTTGAGEGITALSNAESGAIKAGVAIAQQAAAAIEGNATPPASIDPVAAS